MAFATKTVKTLRNHWKKSVFAALAIPYGCGYLRDWNDTQNLMRAYCEKAAAYGNQSSRKDEQLRRVTVILNPTANKRKAETEFEKYCAPILHLAGILIDIRKTESVGHAKTLIDELNGTGAVVVAGGDGTISEVVTGLMRRTNENTNGLVPVGILPLGQMNNSLAQRIFYSRKDKLQKVRALADASMAIVEESTKPIDVLRVEMLEGDNKRIYAVSGIKWGAYRDAALKKDSYWYYGGLRKYATYIFNGFKSNLTWNCDATINFSAPCSGCTNCIKVQPVRWYNRFLRSNNKPIPEANPECQRVTEKNVSTVDFTVSIPEVENEDISKLQLTLGPQKIDYLDFVKNGWRTENGENRNVEETIKARLLEIKPKITSSNEEAWFSIDNESFELDHVRVTILPKVLKVFCKKSDLQ